MMSFLRLRAVLLALVFAIAGSLPFFTSATYLKNNFFFEVTISSSQNGVVQLFYDVGRGYNEQDSGFKPIIGGDKPMLFRTGLPPGTYRKLRFDPINCEASVFFTDARIVDRSGHVIRKFSPEEFGSPNQISSALTKNGGLEIRVIPGGSDPNLEIMIGEPIALHVPFSRQLLASIKPFLIIFILVLALAALPAGRIAASRLGRLVPWSQAHPYAAVATLAVLVVAVECHPVIFFGKSFVSPDIGVLLLYDEFPVLPGYRSTEIENAQGSDVGALMWWHLYCPVIAHDALFRDHELPLWNRYSMSGLPLLGQGQSMFGDPLNWLSVFSRSAAWSWDLRFVLDRWLLCCGLGLTVFALTRSLPSALLVTIGAGFLGFFGFRVTHPANFSLCYGAWILFPWVRMCQASTLRSVARWALLLLLVNFSVATSGTLKEASMLIACLNLAGLLLVLFGEQPWRLRLRDLAVAATAGGVLVLITAPLSLSFLSTLKRSWTSYDTPAASQAPSSMMISFFDDLFSRQMRPGEIVHLPATNFLYLLGVLWALIAARELMGRRSFQAIGLATLVPFALVYGMVPASLLTQIPFIANIIHIDNSLSCPLIILTGVLAGFGFEYLFRELGRPSWKREFVLTLLPLGLLVGMFESISQYSAKSGFFIGYAWSLIIAVVALPVGLHVARRKDDRSLFAAVLLVGISLLTWRHGQYLHTAFDDYVFNPTLRTDLHPVSPAVSFVDAKMKEPSRPIGFGLNLFPGYNQMLGWESILGVDPLRNRYHDELAAALGLPRVRAAEIPIVGDEAHTPDVTAGLDLLNVRYYLAKHSKEPREIPGLTRLGQFDLDVYESETAWPRAFFTDRLWLYENPEELAAKVKAGDRRPLAATDSAEHGLPDGMDLLSHDLATRAVRSADHYRLTTNTTSFEVDAPSAGVIVLSETYYRDEFRVTVNDKPVEYFRVNHAYKGVFVGAPGHYRVEFSYWPHTMTLALILSALGFAGALALGWLAFRPLSMRVPLAT